MSFLDDNELQVFANTAITTGRCSTCKFWIPFEDPHWRGLEENPKYEVGYDGECRRYAPRLTLHDIDPVNHRHECEALWPTTHYEDWCGDYIKASDKMKFSTSVSSATPPQPPAPSE